MADKVKISVKNKKTGKEVGFKQDLPKGEKLWVNDYKKGTGPEEGTRRAKQFIRTGDAKFFKHATKGK